MPRKSVSLGRELWETHPGRRLRKGFWVGAAFAPVTGAERRRKAQLSGDRLHVCYEQVSSGAMRAGGFKAEPGARGCA